MVTPGSVEDLLCSVKLLLSETLVRQVGACFQFDISSEDGQHHRYYVDLSQGNGSYIAVNMPQLQENVHSYRSSNRMQVVLNLQMFVINTKKV